MCADPAETQALILRELERHDAVATAARARSLAAFTAAQGHCGDADYSPRAWLMHQTGITRGAAAAHTAWARRAAGHRLVLAALAAGQISESYARAICQWTGRLPEESREAAEEILLAAAAAGMGLRDLAEAMRRLAVSDLLPERAGQPVKAWVHVSLADLLRLEGSPALLEQWTVQVRARWAARRAGASEGGSDGGAWLDGHAEPELAARSR
jgi:hypothetical protein